MRWRTLFSFHEQTVLHALVGSGHRVSRLCVGIQCTPSERIHFCRRIVACILPMRMALGPLLVAVIASSAVAAKKTACSSKMPGDFKFSTCTGFCREASHCRYCKCKECTICSASGAILQAESQSISTASSSKLSFSSIARNATHKAHKKKRNATSVTPAPAALAALAVSVTPRPTAARREKCRSNMKGDFAYEACGTFCKPSKSSNHCKFCKCKTCSFCASAGGGSKPTENPISASASTSVHGHAHARASAGAPLKKAGLRGESKALGVAGETQGNSPGSAAAAGGTITDSSGRGLGKPGFFFIGLIVFSGLVRGLWPAARAHLPLPGLAAARLPFNPRPQQSAPTSADARGPSARSDLFLRSRMYNLFPKLTPTVFALAWCRRSTSLHG
jgi:hypothetical protein